MNRRGFTLIELLCVISLLAIISTIATIGLMKLSKNSKENLYCAKLELIKTAALEYANHYELELNESTEYYQDYKSITITVQDLIDNQNIMPDKDNILKNPLDDKSLNETKIIIYLKDNQPYILINSDIVC